MQKKNIYLGAYSSSHCRLELTDLYFNEQSNPVNVFDSKQNILGIYNSYDITFKIAGNLITDDKNYPISVTTTINSYPQESRFFKSGVFNHPASIDEKKVIDNLINKFVHRLYKAIAKDRKRGKK